MMSEKNESVTEKVADSNMEQTGSNLDMIADVHSYNIARQENGGEETDIADEALTASEEAELERVSTILAMNKDIPDKFTGWGLLSVIGCFFFNFNTWGSNSAFALYLQAYINDNLFPDANKMGIAAIGGFAFGSGVIFGPLINYLVGILGIKKVAVVGIVIQLAGVLLASFATKLWQLYCTQGVMQGIGMGFIAIPSVIIVPQWFKGGPGGKRNYAVGIMCAGSGLGGIIYNIGMEPILRQHGWRWSLRTQAIMCAVLNIMAVFLIRSRNKEVKPIYKIYDKAVYSVFGSQIMMLWEMFTILGYVTLMYNLGDFTRSLGYDNTKASVVSTMVAVGIIYGRPIMGKIADYIGPIQATIIASWLVCLFDFAMWIPCRNYATAVVFAMFEGSLMGTIWLTMPTINGAVIGLQKFGIGMSLSCIAVGATGIVSPIIGIALKADGPVAPTQYQHPAIFVGFSYFGAGLSLCILRGWIIVRNRLAKNCKTESERLQIKVPIRDAILEMFHFTGEKV